MNQDIRDDESNWAWGEMAGLSWREEGNGHQNLSLRALGESSTPRTIVRKLFPTVSYYTRYVSRKPVP